MGQGQATPSNAVIGRRRVEDVCNIDHNRRLGQGSFGTVWLATLVKGGDRVAVKELDKRKMREMAIPEAMVLAEVDFMRECGSNDKFVRLLDHIETMGIHFLILEFCDGGDLEGAAKECEGRLHEVQVARIVKPLLEGVAFLHGRKICHRDIKPANIMISGGNACSANAKVKLADFGIATRLDDGGKLLTHKVGTPAFMAPEMHLLPSRSKGYDAKVDIWAMGVVMVFLLSLEYPFTDANGRLLREQLLKGDLPLWSMDGFSGLFVLVQEAAGIRPKRPSRWAQGLIRQLLNPKRQERLSAKRALENKWFKPGTNYEDRGDDLPLLKWSEFEEGLTDLDRELRRVAGDVSVAAMGVADAMQELVVEVDIRRRSKKEVERASRCHFCKQPSSGSCHICPKCSASVCFACAMRELVNDLKCPNCKDRTHNAESLAEFLAAGEAWHALTAVSSMLSEKATKAADKIALLGGHAWASLEQMRTPSDIRSF